MSNDTVIRKASTDDFEALCSLYRKLDQYHVEISPGNFKAFDEPVRPKELLLAKIYDADQVLFVAEHDTQLVGFSDAQLSSNPPYPMFKPRDFVLIDNIYVDPEMRGSGLATRLLAAVKERTRQKGLDAIQLKVYSGNLAATRFYEREGFARFSTTFEIRP